MTWARIDDSFHSHPKVRRAWNAHPRALGLHVLAISYAASQLTDGGIDAAFARQLVGSARASRRVTDALVESGLWIPNQDGWEIHDWADYNPTRAEVLARREADRQRKNAVRSAWSPTGIRAESDGNPLGVNPSHPDPSLKGEKEEREERRTRPRGRIGGPTAAQANAAADSWAQRKQQLTQERDEP
jgi:hypothetical protein